MKKILLTAALTMISAGTVYADSNTGCGLGSLLWDGKANTTVSQAFQATTNATFGNQTFGITTGTLGCSTPAKFVKSEELNRFVKSNIDNLATDIARGHGENLDAFAELLQVPVEKRAEFAAKLQSNFAKVFTSDQVVLAEVIDNTITVTN
jgi:hypothetical protein